MAKVVVQQNQSCLGLIAGDGQLPFEVARAAANAGHRVCAIGYPGITDPELENAVDAFHWLSLGQLEMLLATFSAANVQDAVMAGKVSKEHLYGDISALRPDPRALALMSKVADLRDDSILDAIASVLSSEGVRLLPQIEFCPDLLAKPGVVGNVEPTAAQLADMAFGWPIAKSIAGLDLGQSVIVESKAVLAVEAIEGTDAAVVRGGQLGRGGACLVKVAKPSQDLRFDLPTIGPGTLRAMLEGGVAALAFEAECTIILCREELLLLADANGVPVVAMGPSGPDRNTIHS
ncbi:MAG: DUF1009 family protein [Myxococcota bacterium]